MPRKKKTPPADKKTEAQAKKPRTKSRGRGRPPEYGENEVPNCCRYCGSKQTARYGEDFVGCGKGRRRVRYRECKNDNCVRPPHARKFVTQEPLPDED